MPTPSLTNEVARLLSTVSTPGDFYATGTSPLPLPRIEVAGVGPIALPLIAAQAAQLISVAQRAPYGRGADTLVDTQVRRTWQIGADQVSIQGKRWAETLQHTVRAAAEGLGVTATVVPELYKLLVYDEGSFFVSHRDTEKSPGMFATLIIALPSVHQGGELVVRHKGREVRLDLDCPDPSEIAFAAFYADCIHEVLPVTAGYRLVLVYNLLRKGRGRKPQPPCHDTERAQLVTLLQRWSAVKPSSAAHSPEKLVYPLEHAYTSAELSFAALKGADAAAAKVLAAAAQETGCELHAALLTIEESGSAEFTGGPYRSGRWDYGDDDDEDDSDDGDFELGEIFDRSATLSHWCKPDGNASPLKVLPFVDDELCPEGALQDLSPDEQHFQEATGNEGASFERSYRRAALVLWSQHRRLAVLNQAGLPVTLPYLRAATLHWAKTGHPPQPWAEAHELAGHMLRTWPLQAHVDPDGEPDERAELLTLLAQLNDTECIGTLITDLTCKGAYAQGDNPALLKALKLLPDKQASGLITGIVKANAARAPGACADLLARAAGAYAGSLSTAATVLVDALPGGPAQSAEPEWSWRRPRVDSNLIVALANALPQIDPAQAERAMAHLLAHPKRYGLDTVIVPAMRKLLAKKKPSGKSGANPSVQRLREACTAHLQARTATPLAPPTDWARTAPIACKCKSCTQLGRFLADANQATWAFKATEFEREHLSNSIKRAGCDLDCSTDKRGRPYTLVCTKNQASYDRLAKQRAQDVEDLAWLAR